MIIYKLTNKINGKSYIGQTRYTLESRLVGHLTMGAKPTYFQKALKKYGLENFNCSVIDNAEDFVQLSLKEAFWIKFFNTTTPNGYNLTTGGESYTLTEQARKNLSSSHKNYTFEMIESMVAHKRGVPRTTAEKQKISLACLGKVRSKETRAKISASKKGIRKTPEQIEKYRIASTGKKFFEETKQKMSEWASGKFFERANNGNPLTFLGKKHSEETKKKLSEIHKLIKHGLRSEETKRKISESHKLISEEIKLGIREKRVRKPMLQCVKDKISQTQTGMKRRAFSEEAKNRMSIAAKKRCERKRIENELISAECKNSCESLEFRL